ncbi:MAG: hypothetical protein WCH99_10115 [Verrucomicrobiota bacterium]
MPGSFGTLTRLLLMASSMCLLTGCQSVVVIPKDREAMHLKANETFTAPGPGWFVPDARMLDILNQLEAGK